MGVRHQCKVFEASVALSLTVAVSALPTRPAAACPAYLPANAAALPVGKRSEVRLFARSDAGWKPLAVQVDALDERGVLKDGDLAGQLVSPLDRLALRTEEFGAKAEAGAPAPCKTRRAVELRTPGATPRHAYLTVCETDDTKPSLVTGERGPVEHDSEKMRIEATRFVYDYQPNNQLMYRQLFTKSRGWPAPVLAGRDADLNLHLDIRKFFTMDFTNSDVESYVGTTHVGDVGMVGSMEFFLRMLFFKINLKMGTTVGFYADSAHVPAVIDVPRDAPSMLNPGSGILYTWQPGEAIVDESKIGALIPRADPESILAGWERNAERGRPFCHSDTCVFRLTGQIRDEAFTLDINVPKPLVERGFYPQWVADVPAFKRAVRWDDDADAGSGTVAIYFDNGGLLKGQYQVDQWIRIGREQDLTAACPAPVDVGGSVEFGSGTVVAH